MSIKLSAIIAMIFLAACAEMTPKEKVIAGTVAAVVIVGVAASIDRSHSNDRTIDRNIQPVNCPFAPDSCR